MLVNNQASLSAQVESLSAVIPANAGIQEPWIPDQSLPRTGYGVGNDNWVKDALGISTSSGTLTAINLESEEAIISGALTVFGRTTLNDLGVTGTITAGLLSIDGLEGKINTIGESLKLQPEGTEGIEMMAGKVTIDTSGNIKTEGEVSAKKYNVDESDKKSASSGQGILPAGKISIEIQTTTVTDKSRIFVTPTTKGSGVLYVTVQNIGKSFTAEIDKALNYDIKFNWLILN